MFERIPVSKFVIIIALLTSIIATVLGASAQLSPETHPSILFGDVANGVILSWGARELGQGLSGLLVVFLLRDARAFAVVLASAWVREILDFFDLFRVADSPTRLFIVVGVSVILHSIALFLSYRAIRKHEQQTPSKN
jgi:hypothetical protein